MISLTPGAGAINTMSNALVSGFRRSFWGILGQQLALVIHVVIVMKLLAKAEKNDGGGPAPAVESGFSMFRRGLWVNLLNPKAIVFFLAFMPQFIRPHDPLLPQYVILTATVVVIDIISVPPEITSSSMPAMMALAAMLVLVMPDPQNRSSVTPLALTS